MTKRAWTPTETAAALGISDRHVRRLVSEHVLTPGKAGFDPIPTLQAYLKHVTKDGEGRRARTELAQVETMRKRLLTRRHLGDMLTAKERATLDDALFEGTWSAWQLAAATFFAELGAIVGLDHRERLRIANVADQAGKAELIRFRDSWRDQQKDVRAYLRDEERIERLVGELSATGERAEGNHGAGDD